MNILLLLVPLSLLLVGVAAWAFAWAVRRGQFDDLDTPALDVLRDDRHDQQQARVQAGSADGISRPREPGDSEPGERMAAGCSDAD